MFFIHFVLIYFIYFIYLILCLLYTGTVDSGGIKLENGKKILDYLYTKNVVNVDIIELNISLGRLKEVEIRLINSVKLCREYMVRMGNRGDDTVFPVSSYA